MTLGVFGLLVRYCVAYAIGLKRWRARVSAARRLRAAQEPSTSGDVRAD